MTIVTSDCAATCSNSSELPSNSFQQSGATNPQSIAASGVPSAFELLFSQQIGSSTSANSVSQDNSTDSTNYHRTTHKSNDVSLHPMKQKFTSNVDSTGSNLLVNPQTSIVSPALSAKLADMASMPVGTSSSNDTAPSTAGISNAVSTVTTHSSGDANGLTPADSELPPQSAPDSDEQQRGEVQPMATSVTPFRDVASRLAQTSSQLTAVLTSAPLTTELVSRHSEAELTSKAPIQEFSAGDLELGSKLTLSVFNVDRGSNLDSSSIENDPLPADPISLGGTTLKPTRRSDESNAPDFAMIPTMYVIRPSSGSSDTAISGQMATAITQQLSDESYQGPTTIRIRMNRSDLGTVDLHLSITNNVVSIRIVTQNQLTQQIINSQMENLRQTLTNSGVTTGQFQVACDSGGQNSSGQSEAAPETVKLSTSASLRWARPQADSLAPTRPTGRLNVVA